MLLDYLRENYGFNEPIFVNEINIKGMSDNALRQNFNRMYKNGYIERFDTGIYYIPKVDTVLSKSYLSSNKVINKKYITDGIKIYGYITGFSFANQIGLTTQNPIITEIVSNEESSKGRNVTIGTKEIRVRAPKSTVTKENYKVLQLLDLIRDYENWTELDKIEVKKRLVNYIRKEELKRDVVKQYLYNYSGVVAKKLIEMEFIYEFTS